MIDRRVLRAGIAHCLEGAVFAAAALRVAGVRHTPVLTPGMIRRRHRVDRRALGAALVGYRRPAR